jgi:phospholipase C
MAALEGIEHVVVLMLENRSFDCMLGKLYPKDPSFEGLSGNERNFWLGQPVPVWPSPPIPLDSVAAQIPKSDPGELFKDMNAQLFNGPRPNPPSPAPMNGFVENYMDQKPPPESCQAVMHYFQPEQVPVISTLAKAFGVCDQWHASAPCQTWPNRFFVHTGTSLGYVDNQNFPIPFPAPSIFKRLSQCGKGWRVYFHDTPQSLLLGDIWLEAPLHYRFFSTFLSDAMNGTLPNYSFIEPRYFTDLLLNNIPNDEHSPHNVLYGEKLIADVYNAVRSSPCWKKTLLVVTYDEHGGCYDHMPPPVAIPPDDHQPNGFTFNTYGVRVPAVIISPYMSPGSRIRAVPTGLPAIGPPYPFDHTSIIATLRRLFNLGAPLTNRDAVAPDLLGPLSLADPTNDGPDSVTATPSQPSISELEQRASAPPNSMQAALSQMAAQLPSKPLRAGAVPPAPAALSAPVPDTVAKAHSNSILQVRAFLGM